MVFLLFSINFPSISERFSVVSTIPSGAQPGKTRDAALDAPLQAPADACHKQLGREEKTCADLV